MSSKDRMLCVFYGLVAVAALIGTWSYNLQFFAIPDNGGIAGFIRQGFANPAAASLSTDLGFLCLAAIPWMLVEGRDRGIRHLWIFVVGSLTIAISVMFPLFLLVRQVKLAGNRLR